MATRHLTSNEKAANGPLPGDHTLVADEHRGSAAIASAGYYPSLSGAEISGADRSGCFPYASFTGSFTEPNQVFAWRSEDDYQGSTFLCTREPGELFLCGGNLPDAKPPATPGPYVAKVDHASGKQIWRTYLDNVNASGHWIGVNNLNILSQRHHRHVVVRTRLALIDADSGRIIRTGSLPSGEAPPEDSHFKHLTVAPDGTLILKNQTRPSEINDQGTMAMIKGIRKGMELPPSTFVAVDGETLEVLDTAPVPELAATPHGITMLDGQIAIYTCATEAAYRYFWDPESRTLSSGRLMDCADLGGRPVDRRRPWNHG